MRRVAGVEVLRERDFRLVFSAGLVSLLGDGIAPVALAFAVLELTGSATDLGLVLAAYTLPLAVCLLAGGVVADRVPRRRVMIAADGVRCAGQAVLGVLLVAGSAQLWQIIAIQAVLGAASGFFNPASIGLMPLVVGPARLQDANALRGVAIAAGGIGGPVIAGILVTTIGSGEALLADALTYAASAVLLLRVRVPEDRGGQTGASFAADLREGWTEVRSRTWVWSIVAGFSVVNMVGAAFKVLGPLVALRQLGGAGAWAAIAAGIGVGALAGALLSFRVHPRRPLLVATLVCAVTALPTALVAAPAPLAAIVAGAVLGGAASMVFNTLWETTLQQHIPRAALSRVSAYDWFGSATFQPIGLAVVGPIAAGLGVSTTLWAAAALELALIGSLLIVRDVRTIGPRPAAAA
jgi:predicted MFS family arabinose efflux permease